MISSYFVLQICINMNFPLLTASKLHLVQPDVINYNRVCDSLWMPLRPGKCLYSKTVKISLAYSILMYLDNRAVWIKITTNANSEKEISWKYSCMLVWTTWGLISYSTYSKRVISTHVYEGLHHPLHISELNCQSFIMRSFWRRRYFKGSERKENNVFKGNVPTRLKMSLLMLNSET